MSDTDKLKAFLQDQLYMTIAVTLDDGTPWATPVRIRRWEGGTFEWDSKTDTEHSKAIEVRPDVAISIFTPEGKDTIQFGFYAHARAKRTSDPNEHGVARYSATVATAFVNDATFVKREVTL